MRRRAFLATVAIALSGCLSSGEESRETATDTTRSVGGTELEVTEWADATASYGGPYSAAYVTARGDPPVVGMFTATFDDGSQASGVVPGDAESYGEHGEDRYHSPGAAAPDEGRAELSGWVVFHPDSDSVRIESVTVDPLDGGSATWQRG